MFSPVEAFLLYVILMYRTQGWCTGFLDVMYTVMVYVLSCRGFLLVIVHRDGVCSLL